tara:strand:+ start:386 stop:565 length:180 start_codon:yes stop_codon:yes gene_type:complete
MNRNQIYTLLVLTFFFLIFGFSGRQDLEDEQNEALHYCEMVELGAWPAYRNDVDCGLLP